MNRTIAWVFAAACGLAIATAGAAPSAQDNEAAAKAAFARGRDLFDNGDFPAAADAFREANRLNPSWKLHYNIGQAEAAAKRYGLALEAFERYLAEGGDEVAPERNDEVIAEIRRLRELVGSAEIKAPEGAVIFVDDMERGAAPLPGTIKLAAGVDHSIRAEKDGAVLESRTVRVGGGESAVIQLGVLKSEQGPDEAPSQGSGAQPAEPAHAGRSPVKVWGWVTLGVGAAAAIAGGAAGGAALSLDKQLQDGCENNVCTTPAQRDDIEKRDSLGVASTVLIVAGAAVAATGIVLLIVGYKKGEAGKAEASLVPAAGPGFAGAAVAGRF